MPPLEPIPEPTTQILDLFSDILGGDDYESLSNLDNTIVNEGCKIDEKSELIELEEETECSICYEKFTKMNNLKCKHMFCYDCLDEWLKENKKCPVCLLEL